MSNPLFSEYQRLSDAYGEEAKEMYYQKNPEARPPEPQIYPLHTRIGMIWRGFWELVRHPGGSDDSQ